MLIEENSQLKASNIRLQKENLVLSREFKEQTTRLFQNDIVIQDLREIILHANQKTQGESKDDLAEKLEALQIQKDSLIQIIKQHQKNKTS